MWRKFWRGTLKPQTSRRTSGGYLVQHGAILTTPSEISSMSESINTKALKQIDATTNAYLSILQMPSAKPTSGSLGTETDLTFRTLTPDYYLTGLKSCLPYHLSMAGKQHEITLNSPQIGWRISRHSLELALKLQSWDHSGHELDAVIKTALITWWNTISRTLLCSGKFTISLGPLSVTTQMSTLSNIPEISGQTMSSALRVVQIVFIPEDIGWPSLGAQYVTNVSPAEPGSKVDQNQYWFPSHNQYGSGMAVLNASSPYMQNVRPGGIVNLAV